MQMGYCVLLPKRTIMPWKDENLSARDTEISLYIKHFTSEYRFDYLPNCMREEVLFTPIGVAQRG